jgi:hypothetical protein
MAINTISQAVVFTRSEYELLSRKIENIRVRSNHFLALASIIIQQSDRAWNAGAAAHKVAPVLRVEAADFAVLSDRINTLHKLSGAAAELVETARFRSARKEALP